MTTNYCTCIEKNIRCIEGRCPTFSIKGILDDIQAIDFGCFAAWDNKTIHSLATDLYKKDLKTISEFFDSFEYFISSDDYILRRRVLMDKLKYMQVNMPDILKKQTGYSEKIDTSNLEFSRLDAILAFDFGDSDEEI
jgi:hypothetical protein